jgi:hypothetical protein
VTRTLGLLGVLVALAGIGVVSIGRARDQLAVIDACEAARAGDTARALTLTDGRIGDSETGRAAAECRCHALIAAGEPAACLGLLEPLVADPAPWMPEPSLAALLIRERRDTGRPEEAAALARAAGRSHPDDLLLFQHELEVRAAVEPESEVLQSLTRRIPERGDVAARMRVAVGQRHLHRGDPPAALRVLGAQPPPDSHAAHSLWFDTVGIAHAMNDDLPAARASYTRWEEAGGRPAEVRARYVLALSISGLVDPERDMAAALRAAREDAAALGDRVLEESLAIRLVFTLVAAGRADEALDTYDALHAHLPMEGVQREELERALRGEALASDPDAARAGRLRFSLASAPPAGAALWITPDAPAEPDAEWERHALDARAVEVERAAALAPQRWVLRDATGAVLGSGAAYPRAGRTHEVGIRIGAAATAAPDADLTRRPSDGRRRVALLLLDCGDWALTQYLRARGELPVMDALFDTGYRAVLDSDPPLTAAALEALVWPARRTDASLVGTFYRFGIELAGLESIGSNPFEMLSWVLPETEDLFAAIGSGERSAANLLLAHGGVRGGRHGEVNGPHGATRRLPLGRTLRPLDADEARRFPALAHPEDEMDAHYVQTIAAEFDATEQLLRGNAHDFVAVRVEPLDILTHAHFGEAAREGQDDGEGLLYDVYRYIDARLGRLHAVLDADDVLIVMSDHGIRTAMEHDRPAIFVATGAGVPKGRAPGRPALRGVSRVVTDLLGVDTEWPETGVASWASPRGVARLAPPDDR